MTNALTISDLAKTVKESNLPASKAEALEAAFMPFFEQVSKHCETAFTIKVSNIGQTAEMGRARAARLALKDIRVSKEKVRKQVKEDALREGQAIDKIAKFLDSVIEPMEKYLLDQEEYGKRQQEKIQEEQRQIREIEAGDLLKYFPAGIDIGAIADEEFAKYLHLAGVQFKAIQDEQKRIDIERMEREIAIEREREAMRFENERLRAEAAEREKAMAEERAERERVQREHEAKIASERAEVERLRRESEAKERAEKQRIEAERIAKEAAEKAAMEAPDKEKLLSFANEIRLLRPPTISSNAMSEILEEAKSNLLKAIKILTNA